MRRVVKILVSSCWAYLIFVGGCWGLERFLGERWWPATLVLFGPTWVFALPAIPLILTAAIFRRAGASVAVILATLVVLFPVMGLTLPLHRSRGAAGRHFRLRVLTNSVHGMYPGAPNWQAFCDYYDFAKIPVDVVAQQEWGGGPLGPATFDGRPGYVCNEREMRLWSRYPVRSLGPLFESPAGVPGSLGIAIAYEISTPAGPVIFVNLHLASPHDAFRAAVFKKSDAGDLVQSNSDSRRAQVAAVAEAARRYGDRVILAGDFNLPPQSVLYRTYLSDLGDAFANAGWGFGWTYCTRGTTARIDHILTGPAWTCLQCRVETHVWSPHRSIIAELELGQGE